MKLSLVKNSMIKNPLFRVAALTTILCISAVGSEPLPLEKGESYWFQLAVDKEKLPPFWPDDGRVKVVTIYDYPWIKVEYRWMPTMAFKKDENGETQSVEPTAKIYQRYLNLNQVLSIHIR